MRPRSRTRGKGQARAERRRQQQQRPPCSSSSFGGLYFVIICTWCLSVIFRQQRGIHDIPVMMRTAFLPQVQQQQQVEVNELLFFNQRRQQQNCTNNNTTTATRTTTRARTRTRTTSSRIPFSVRTDLKLRTFLGSNSNNTSLPYTTHRCVRGKGIRDPMGDYLHWQRRTCLYENLYYHPATETFHYYDSPSSSQVGSSSSSSTGSSVDAFRVADEITTASGYIVAEKTKQVGKRHFAVSKVRMGNFVRFRPLPLDDVREAFDNGSAAAEVAVVETPDDAVFVLYKPSYDSNFGHYIFDTVLSIYTMLDFFGYHRTPRSRGSDCTADHTATATTGRPYQHIPVHLEQQHHGEHNDPFYRCRKNVKSGRWPECSMMLRRVMAGLLGIVPEVRNVTSTAATGEQEAEVEVDVDIPRTGNLFGAARDPEANNNHLVALPHGAEMVLLPAVIAGPGRLAAVACAGDCVLHRASQMARFRAWMFQHVFEDAALGREMSRQLPDSNDDGGSILTVSLAVGNSHDPAALCDFRETIAPALELHFGNRHRVAVVDMATLTLQQQAVLVASSAIYITNQGGGGASSLFLSQGSTALLFYNSTFGKFPLEANLYGTVGGYMNAEWLDTNEYCVAAAGTGASGGSNQHEQSVRKFVDLVEDLLASNRIQQQQQQHQHRHCQQHGRAADSRSRKLMQTILDGIT